MAELAELQKVSNVSVSDEQSQWSNVNEERHNKWTHSLHEASECGNLAEVRKILAQGRADLSALTAGHRALRTALHKASAYGHTEVVKLLLKVGICQRGRSP